MRLCIMGKHFVDWRPYFQGLLSLDEGDRGCHKVVRVGRPATEIIIATTLEKKHSTMYPRQAPFPHRCNDLIVLIHVVYYIMSCVQC